MERGKLELEELFSKQMKGFERKPSDDLWNKIEVGSGIVGEKGTNWTGFALLSVLFAVLVSGFWDSSLPFISEVSDLKTIVSSAEVFSDKADVVRRDSDEVVLKRIEKTEPIRVLHDSEYVLSAVEAHSNVQFLERVLQEERKVSDKESIAAITVEAKKDVRVDFVLSENRGCAPLTIFFKNKSTSLERSVWSFGDGKTTHSVDAHHTYGKPGVYIVSLSTVLKGDLKLTAVDTIRIFDKPQADCELSVSDTRDDSPVFFNNYSYDAVAYEWSLGDSVISREKEPIKYSSELKGISVKLKVWSDDFCVDSMVITNPIAQGHNYYVNFPNAFVPDNTGASNGSYLYTNKSASVFFPRHKGLENYSLQVYNRYGIKVFETNDVNVGWNGYYQNVLLKQDVYIWKVRGTYSDGKTFEKRGDVILLRKLR